MASNESANDREYYRQSFDRIYHPIIYELIRELQVRAESFQIAVDPIYDKFLRDVHCTVTDDSNNCKKRKYDDEKCMGHELKQKEKRFADIAIMTAGNNKVSGFSNISHEDEDFMLPKFLQQCLEVIRRYTAHILKNKI